MRKSLLWAILAFAVSLGGCAKEIKKSEDKNTKKQDAPEKDAPFTLDPSKVPMEAFFPLKTGMKRTYLRTLGYQDARIEVVYGTAQPGPGGGTMIRASSTLYEPGKDAKAQSANEVSQWLPGKGAFVKPGNTKLFQGMGIPILPAKWTSSGQHWELGFSEKAANGAPIKGTFDCRITGPEWVQTKAGKFETIHSEITVIAQSGKQVDAKRYEFWFAKDIGLVKYTENTRSGMTSVLLAKMP